MYADPPHYREMLQGDVYRLTISSARFEANRPEAAFRLGAFTFGGEIEDQLYAVLSHDCDLTDNKVNEKGQPISPDKFPVVLGRVAEPDQGSIRQVEAVGGFDRVNDVNEPVFYNLFYYPNLPGESGNKHILNLSDVITIHWKQIRPKAKLVELDDDARFALRVKLILHFGRGNDAGHPLAALASHLGGHDPSATPTAPPTS
jgi:hypothetical protein